MALNAADQTLSSSSSRPTYSCVRCSDRKVKCDRQYPCSACVRHNVQCVFRAPPPPRRRPKRAKDLNLKEKLKRYEGLLQNLGVDPNLLAENADTTISTRIVGSETHIIRDALLLPTPASSTTELERPIATSQVLQGDGRSKIVDNTLWSRVVEEFHDSGEALDDYSSEASDAEASDEGLGFILEVPLKLHKHHSHPPTEIIYQLWQVFIENVDPLTKVVHVPSLQPVIQKAATNIKKIPRSYEALMFAIYAAAVMSLKHEECERRLGESREMLLSRYISATEWALSRAKFMGTTSIVVLQALVTHILSVRNILGPRTVWSLTGAAIRIAEGMGLHRDGTSLGIPPFEAEIRRRIWWQLKMHDFRAAELVGLAKFRGFNPEENTCEPPVNINDSDLYPGMASPAPSSTKLTDMVYFVLRTELMVFGRKRAAEFRQQDKDASKWDYIASRSDQRLKDQIIIEIEELLESKYLRYCDPSQPLQHLTMLMARSSLNTVRFLCYHPRRWASQEQTPESERQLVWKSSIALLEQYDIMQSDRRLQGFAWYVAYFLQWHIIIHVLDSLRARPLMSDAEKAWRVIESTYQNNPDIMSNTKKPIHVAVGNLCLKAWTAREAAIMHEGRNVPPEPEFIAQLRQQREAAKARRKARDNKNKQVDIYPSKPLTQAIETKIQEFKADSLPQQASLCEMIDNTTNQAIETDPLWLNSGLDDGMWGNSGDVMDLDTDLMLAQDYGFEDPTGQSISWNQWDAWLGETNLPHAA